MNCRRLAAGLSVVLVLSWADFALSDDWPQWAGPRRDAEWRETGLVERFPEGGPPVRWRTPVGGGYAGPAVAAGRVYVTDRQVKAGGADPDNPFTRGATPAIERVLCLNEADGSVLWTHEHDCPYTVSYPAGPRCTPAVDGDRVYTLGAEGHLFCLNVANGDVVWSAQLRELSGMNASPVWGFSAHPLVDGDRLICMVGGEGSAVVAFNKHTGEVAWRSLDAFGGHGPGYCPPVIIEPAGRRQLLIWTPHAVSGLEPETGKAIWTQEWEIQNGLSVPMPRLEGNRLFLTAFYDGSLMLEFNDAGTAVREAWKRKGRSERNTDALHSIMPTPWFEDGLIFGVDSYGELRGLDASNGDRLWETYAATGGESARWANTFLVKQGDRFILPNEQGDLILARLTREGYEELSRAHVIEPTGAAQGREIVWSHPAFANRCVYLRNDKEIVCVSLAKD
ncbi:MAG: PQQ-like beta-propeller repeat protein [Planctomyces sp.]|nr:PQQ-like beta-propeller repeat protein [Planctomyces sp.]